MDFTSIKDRRGIAEDKIDVAFNEAVFVILPARCGVERVLPADEAAVLEHSFVGVNHHRHGLCAGAVRVFEGEMGRLKRRPFYVSGGTEEGASYVSGARIVSDDGAGGITAEQRHARPILRNGDSFVISTGANLNVKASIAINRRMVNRHLHRLKITAAVLRDDDMDIS